MRIFKFQLILALPSEFRSSLGIPTNLHYRDTTLLRLLDLSVHDLYMFFHEVEALFDLDLFEWDNKSPVIPTLFQVRDVESRMYTTEFAR